MTGRETTEVAQILAELVPALPDQTAESLYRMLGQSIAAPSAAIMREARLGLLVEMIAGGSGEIPTVEAYSVRREARHAQGAEWPTHSTLVRAYGHWLAAVRAAMRLWAGDRRIPQDHRHALFRPAYRREDVAMAISACRAALDGWPTQWEYEEWGRISRRAARLAGNPEPRIPTLKPIRKLCGSWTSALAMTRREASDATSEHDHLRAG